MGSVQMVTIKPADQQGVLENYWMMLRECDSFAHSTGSPVLKHLVGEWYKEWNRVTGDSKTPEFLRLSQAKNAQADEAGGTFVVKAYLGAENWFSRSPSVIEDNFATLQDALDEMNLEQHAANFQVTVTAYGHHAEYEAGEVVAGLKLVDEINRVSMPKSGQYPRERGG